MCEKAGGRLTVPQIWIDELHMSAGATISTRSTVKASSIYFSSSDWSDV